MKLGLIKRVSKEDLAAKGELPGWIDTFLDVLNDFIEKVTKALNGNLNFADNFLCKEHVQDFASGTAYTINPSIDGRNKLRVYGVLPLDCNGAELDKHKWEKLADGNVSVTLTFTAAATKKCTVLLLLR